MTSSGNLMTPDIDSTVRRILAIAADADAATLTADTRVADLGIDSVYAMAMTTLLEMELEITLPLDAVIRLLSLERVGDITASLTTLASRQSGAQPS
jgi:acyl carrier protein